MGDSLFGAATTSADQDVTHHLRGYWIDEEFKEVYLHRCAIEIPEPSYMYLTIHTGLPRRSTRPAN